MHTKVFELVSVGLSAEYELWTVARKGIQRKLIAKKSVDVAPAYTGPAKLEAALEDMGEAGYSPLFDIQAPPDQFGRDVLWIVAKSIVQEAKSQTHQCGPGCSGGSVTYER